MKKKCRFCWDSNPQQFFNKMNFYVSSTSSFAKKKKKPVDFDDELKIGDVRYDNMT